MSAGHPGDLALAALAGPPGHDGRAISSDLSVDEAVLLHERGYEARGLVMGCSIFHIGYPFRQFSQSGEVEQLSRAMYDAREAAIGRLTEEARRVGAEGVVGVRLDISALEGKHHIAQFIAVGTAVAPIGSKRRTQTPFTSGLSGKDFHLLDRAGYRPLGLVIGSCVYQFAYRSVSQVLSGAGRYQELTLPTEALTRARELAMGRLQREAEQLRATGVIGVEVVERSHAWGSHVIEFFARGTAVRLSATEHQHLAPRLVVPLEDALVTTDPGAITGKT